jgi:hypothetical protein
MEIVAAYGNDNLFSGSLVPVVIDAIDRAILSELRVWRDRVVSLQPAEVAAEIDKKIDALNAKLEERKLRREKELQALREEKAA